MYAGSCINVCFAIALLVVHKKPAAKCISGTACGEEAGGRRPGRDVEISTDCSSTGQSHCEMQTQEKTQDRQTSDTNTV